MKLICKDIDKDLSQNECIKLIVDTFVENKITTNDYYDAILKRQKSASLYIGNFVAIPHGVVEKKGVVIETGIVFFRFKKGINWDDNLTHYVIGIASNENDHMDILTNIAINFDTEEKVKKSLTKDLNSVVKEFGWK